MRLPDEALPIDSEAIYGLWDELSDFGVQACDEALAHCMRALCRWTHADNAFWIGAVRLMDGAAASDDPLSGWRLGSIQSLMPGQTLRTREAARKLTNDPDHASRTITAQAGAFRSYRLSAGDWLDLDAYRKSAHFDARYRQQGVSDRIWVVFPVNADAESYVCLDRHGDRHGEGRDFGEAEVELAARTLRGIKWFHRQLLLSHGLGIGEGALTDAERGVLHALLSGATEKEIAVRMHLTPGSVHQYAIRIYRKLEVGSRGELMALWLSGRPAGLR